MTGYYHGTRTPHSPGSLIQPSPLVYLTPHLDEAIWDAEVAPGHEPARVYRVEPLGTVEQAAVQQDPPTMSCSSRQPLRVTEEVTEWTLYHGTRAHLQPGDRITPGCLANFGEPDRRANFVYFSRTLDAATWGAELARGEGPGRIYRVQPTGPIEPDPNLTNRKYRGNPTQSYRSRHPLQVIAELPQWCPHPPEVVAAMKAGLERLTRSGAPIDD